MDMVTEGGANFNDFEREIHQKFLGLAREELKERLEHKDREIMQHRDKKTYRNVGRRTRTVKTMMGEVTFERNYYRMNCGDSVKYVCLLDESLGLDEQCGLFSEVLVENILEMCMNMSFRKAANCITTMTGQTISHGGAWNILQEAGRALEKQEDRLVELNEKAVLHGDIDTKVLFIEMDGVYLSMQGKDRPKKIGKREIKIATYYRGWEVKGKNRVETVDKIAYAGFDDPKQFQKRREAQLARYYDTDEIEFRLLNGDGASWIKGIDEDVIEQLDPFHRSRAIMRWMPEKENKTRAFQLIREKDVDGLLSFVSEQRKTVASQDVRDKLDKLYKYFLCNKDKLLTWQERGIELPPPPAGIEYKSLGTQEHFNSDIITHRMKRRKASWSKQGASHMAKLLCHRITQENVEPREINNSNSGSAPQPVFSVAQTPKTDGKGKVSAPQHGSWPFENSCVTNGRKAIRNMFEYRTM